MIVLGMIAIAFPFFASVTSVLVFGWIFVFAGIAQIISTSAWEYTSTTGVTPQFGSVVGTLAFGDESNNSSFFPNCCVNSSYVLQVLEI